MGFLLAVLPIALVALLCETGEPLRGSAAQVGSGGPCRQGSGKENRLSVCVPSVGEGEGISTFWSLTSRADIETVNGLL